LEKKLWWHLESHYQKEKDPNP